MESALHRREGIFSSVEPDLALAHELFAALDRHWDATPDRLGMCRASYSHEEEEGAHIVIAAARDLGLRVFQDKAGNYYLVLEGEDASLPALVSGSHLDSVPRGGRYDGPAGVVAPLCAIAGFIRAGIKPKRTLCAMIVRGEESAWYGQVSIGSKLAVGELPVEKLHTLKLKDTETTLMEAMRALGIAADGIKPKERLFPLAQTACFIELHIEQGPQLKEWQVPVGIVTGIRGNIRYRRIACTGEAGHTGTVPHAMRRDAVRASAWAISQLETIFEEMQSLGKDLVFTFPVATTGPAASHTTIPPHFEFALEVRSQSREVLEAVPALLEETLKAAKEKYTVDFAACDPVVSLPALMDEAVQKELEAAAQSLKLPPPVKLPSGAGHDTAVFSNAGVPGGMIFIRHNGISHAPEEDMPMEDFALGTQLLTAFFARGYRLPGEATGTGGSFTDQLLAAGGKEL